MSGLLSLVQLEAAKSTRAARTAAEGTHSPGRSQRSGTPPRAAPQRQCSSATPGADGLTRCPWSTSFAGAGSDAYVAYHDEEWGRPKRGDPELFELLVLEGAQAGLSWATILSKRNAYRRAFEGFDPDRVAAFTDADVERLMAADSGIVRHRGKVASAINNARCVLEVRRQHGSFSTWIWGFAGPEGAPVVNEWVDIRDVPSKTPASERLSKALKEAGFKFVGPTTAYSFMQAAGLVNDHLVSCFCHGTASREGDGGSGGTST